MENLKIPCKVLWIGPAGTYISARNIEQVCPTDLFKELNLSTSDWNKVYEDVFSTHSSELEPLWKTNIDCQPGTLASPGQHSRLFSVVAEPSASHRGNSSTSDSFLEQRMLAVPHELQKIS